MNLADPVECRSGCGPRLQQCTRVLRIAGRVQTGIGFRVTDCIRIINHGPGAARVDR